MQLVETSKPVPRVLKSKVIRWVILHNWVNTCFRTYVPKAGGRAVWL